MKTCFIIIMGAFIAGLFFSCEKETNDGVTGEAVWIKVMADSKVCFPGKIRSDESNHIFCSYNYVNYSVDTNSAIIKLDQDGSLLWRHEFDDLTIFDFVINGDGNAVVASYTSGAITLTSISSEDGSPSALGTGQIPIQADKIKNLFGIKIFINVAGNYIISGTVFYRLGNVRLSVGFLMEADAAGNTIWLQSFFFPGGINTTLTGCAQSDDGYVLFGNSQLRDPAISSFFIVKTNELGDSLDTKIYTTSSYDTSGADSGTYHGYYCYTSDIIQSGDGNFYACAFNEKYNLPNVNGLPVYSDDDNSARIFKISGEGDTIKSVRVNYDFQNMAVDLVTTNDNGLLIGFNPINLVGTFYLGQQNSYTAQLNPEMTVKKISYLQTHYFDYLGSVCSMPDGHYAIASMIQSLGDENFVLEIIKTDEKGNF